MDYCRIRSHRRKLCRCRPRNHHRKPILQLILKSSRRMDYCKIRNHWRKLSRCRPRNHHRKPVLRLTLIFSAQIDHCRIRNHWRNCVGADPEIITGNQFYGWLWNLTAHNLQQNQKSLTKTGSLQTQKWSPETSLTAHTEIFTAYGLLQNQKS